MSKSRFSWVDAVKGTKFKNHNDSKRSTAFISGNKVFSHKHQLALAKYCEMHGLNVGYDIDKELSKGLSSASVTVYIDGDDLTMTILGSWVERVPDAYEVASKEALQRLKDL